MHTHTHGEKPHYQTDGVSAGASDYYHYYSRSLGFIYCVSMHLGINRAPSKVEYITELISAA